MSLVQCYHWNRSTKEVNLAVIDEVGARVREGGSIATRSFDSESGGSKNETTVCGPDGVLACQSSAGQ